MWLGDVFQNVIWPTSFPVSKFTESLASLSGKGKGETMFPKWDTPIKKKFLKSHKTNSPPLCISISYLRMRALESTQPLLRMTIAGSHSLSTQWGSALEQDCRRSSGCQIGTSRQMQGQWNCNFIHYRILQLWIPYGHYYDWSRGVSKSEIVW